MNVLITGTSSGIGKGCAKYFLKNGHKVYGFDRKESTIEHPDYKHYCLDIRDKEMYPELPPIQIVINNAGVQNEDDIDINLKGTIAVTEHYAVQPEIRSVIMIGSASGHTGSEFPEYAASPFIYQKCCDENCSVSGDLQQSGFRRSDDRVK